MASPKKKIDCHDGQSDYLSQHTQAHTGHNKVMKHKCFAKHKVFSPVFYVGYIRLPICNVGGRVQLLEIAYH